jgi:esterase/lipase superfamily enzyme
MTHPKHRCGALILMVVLQLLAGPRVHGQATSSVVGVTSDSAGGALAGITVTLTNKETQAQFETKSDSEGNFRLDAIPVGRYSVTARILRFSTLTTELEVSVGQTASLNLTFRPIGVEVAAESPGISEAKPDQTYVEMKVFYATDRKPSGNRVPATFYSGERTPDGSLALGTCKVSIPNDHKIGKLESPKWWKLQFRQDPNREVVLLGVAPYSEGKFYSELASSVQATGDKKALVFIHGYDVTFEDAARRTAQLAYDLKFQGAPIFYSWPSKGAVGEYLADEATIEWAKPHLKEFLEQLAARSGADSIYLVAHSMGNRALTGALQDLMTQARATPAPHFREVILAAPDIDAGVFRQLSSSIQTASDRVTLYASSNDKALAFSKTLHDYPRAGESGENLVVQNGIDTVDVSAVDTGFLGHSYFGDNTSVMSDIHNLLAGTPAASRICLSSKPLANLKYWLYGPPGTYGCPVPLPEPQ